MYVTSACITSSGRLKDNVSVAFLVIANRYPVLIAFFVMGFSVAKMYFTLR